MKNCTKCNAPLDDNAEFCTKCGEKQPVGQQAAPQTNFQQQPYYTAPNPYDHTAQFDAADISSNKVLAMLVYLLGTVGIIIALLAGNNSPYIAFHVREALKFVVINTLLAIIGVVLAFTIIVPILVGISVVVLFVVKIITFFQICGGKAVEPCIIRSLSFLK